ncbi:deoxyguanosine kinase [Deinococcus irradiatisoli]|uniref:Deoxyguanosine kinase n=1 Tax=Deinococcus irradiatisoli TaxID=2202254 RepID=A0A2Z3JF27_9DEIO|nr:deoxynucleoside kinase [Deinococcus irradiatisoli]AWN22000.1 deoxyguanosine kinase [Deinococcus irradiatisoli]
MYVVVEGPIGVGKTSLSSRLAERYAAELHLEVVEENPFLARFYESPETYAFQVQVFFLLFRFKQLSGISQAGLFSQNVVGDYLFDKDFIFASMNLKDAEFALYQDLYSHLSPRLPVPDLVVYLRAEPQELLRRIARRRRPFEEEMPAAYLAELTRRYDEYFRSYPGPVLTVGADELDFVGNPEHERDLLRRIDAALGTPVPAR